MFRYLIRIRERLINSIRLKTSLSEESTRIIEIYTFYRNARIMVTIGINLRILTEQSILDRFASRINLKINLGIFLGGLIVLRSVSRLNVILRPRTA